MSNIELSEHLIVEVAIQAAKKAGKILIGNFGTKQNVTRSYSHDVKLEVDSLCEEVIIDNILRSFPDHVIFTEEGGRFGQDGDYVWFIDPLDGTMNYAAGLHYFCSCVACYRRTGRRLYDPNSENTGQNVESSELRTQDSLGTALAGIVYAPAIDELFWGVKGKGAYLNNRPIHIDQDLELTEALLATSVGSDEKTMIRMEGLMPRLARRARKVRVFGACGLDISYVAANRFGALIHRKIRCWDFAAAGIILQEAGGVLDSIEIGPNQWDTLACAPKLRDPLMEILGDRA